LLEGTTSGRFDDGAARTRGDVAELDQLGASDRRTRGGTLGAMLEKDRLEDRTKRLCAVIVALCRRADQQQTERGRSGRHIHVAIADLEAELVAIDLRLQDLARASAATRFCGEPAVGPGEECNGGSDHH
jgi:hypothetical protein